ncbi:MAG: hypothetical protein GY883_08935 [Shimia sp.]|nr:hypothetical protein [Shimia sp.]
MKCPVDGATLLISDRNGVEIDYCPTCRGVWLDRGELDKIIDRAGSYMPEREQGQIQARGHEGKPRKKRKMGGFLDDIFDF